MKKTFELEDLDCANCAQKMQDAVAKLDGVKFVTVNFLSQKMTLEADEDVFDDVLKKAVKEISKVEPDVRSVAHLGNACNDESVGYEYRLRVSNAKRS